MSRFKFQDIAIVGKEKKKPTESDKANYIGLEHLSPDTFEVAEFGSDVAPKGEKLIMRKGDVLFGKRRAYQKKVGIAPCDGIFSAHGMVLRPNTGVVDKRFFPFFIRSDRFLDEAIRVSVGSLSPTVNWKDLKDLEFELPDIQRQAELAEVLWAMEDLRAKYRQLLVFSDDIVKSRFVELASNAGCKEYPFKDILLAGPQNGFYRKGSGTTNGTQIVKMKQLFENESMDRATDMDMVDLTEKELERFRLTPSDLLFGRRSLVLEGAGKCRRVGNIQKSCVFESSMLRVTLKESVALPRYIQTWFETQAGIDAIVRIRSVTTVSGITGKDLAQKVRISLPEIDIQKQFNDFAEQVDKSRSALQQALDDLNAMMTAILNEELSA